MPASPNSWPSRSRPRDSTSAFSTWSPIPGPSSRPRPISDRTGAATPIRPIWAPSAASARSTRCCSSPRCSTRPAPPSSAASHTSEAGIMAKNSARDIEVKAFATHQVITQPNPLRKLLRRVEDKDLDKDLDDPVARAEQALAGLSGEFKDWMADEVNRLSTAYAAIRNDGFTKDRRDELFRAAHDIKGDAATFGFPAAAGVAESLCRVVEHAPYLERVPTELFTHHINAILAIVHENTKLDSISVSAELSRRLRKVADDYLADVNRDRPEHLEVILAPSIAPAG